MRIEKPVYGRLTQGTIFTGAHAEEYVGKPTWGLCITARCDMAHQGKANVFNYLPIVTVDDWLTIDGARLLADRLYSEIRSSAANLLKSAKKSISVLDSYDPNFIADNLLPGDVNFKKAADKLETISRIRALTPPSSSDVATLANINSKCAERLMKELWSQQLSGYYYLKGVGESEHCCDTGYVILLREVHHLPYAASEQIANGLLVDATNKLAHPFIKNCVFDFACPTGLVASPWIEHVMQQFSLLFSRIGLPDPNPSHLAALNERVSRGT